MSLKLSHFSFSLSRSFISFFPSSLLPQSFRRNTRAFSFSSVETLTMRLIDILFVSGNADRLINFLIRALVRFIQRENVNYYLGEKSKSFASVYFIFRNTFCCSLCLAIVSKASLDFIIIRTYCYSFLLRSLYVYSYSTLFTVYVLNSFFFIVIVRI